MKIAVYGGSFNPPHNGHVNAAGIASSDLKPDLFLIIPDNIPPHKLLAEGSPSPDQRLEMCRLAFSGIDNAVISTIELNRGGKSYTVDTLRQLHELYSGADIHLIIGQDMADSFDTWYHPDEILEMCTLYVLPRTPESSTLAREDLKTRGGSEYLPPAVYEYIIRNHLYGT